MRHPFDFCFYNSLIVAKISGPKQTEVCIVLHMQKKILISKI